MKLLSWNVARQIRAAPGQLEFIRQRQPDVVTLQEVGKGNRDVLSKGLADCGFDQQVETFSLHPELHGLGGPRASGILVATRRDVRLCGVDSGLVELLWPERMLSVQLETGDGPIDLNVAHVPPGSSNGWIKIDTIDGIVRVLARDCRRSRILCGDFNTPKIETSAGDVVTWGQRIRKDGTVGLRKRIRGQDGARWDAAERMLMVGLGGHGMRDIFRDLHGYQVEASSWIASFKRREAIARRFDHVFASSDLIAESVEYLHEPRLAGLSDHAPIEAVLRLNR